jgi:hypothetical protein
MQGACSSRIHVFKNSGNLFRSVPNAASLPVNRSSNLVIFESLRVVLFAENRFCSSVVYTGARKFDTLTRV